MSHANATASLPLLPSFRRQQLLLEFASLKRQCPDGIYLTPNSGDPSSWTGVYFVREGPYAAAILRFELLFPPSYPEAPPLLILSTEIFHPLLVPLTTYTFNPGSSDPTATYSASETERLPPGAISLRYGFPHWFSTAERGRTSTRESSSKKDADVIESDQVNTKEKDTLPNPGKYLMNEKSVTITVQLLAYLKSVFEDPITLDALPLEAAGNPNAWHAWRSHRGLPKRNLRSQSPTSTPLARAGTSPRNPADWNWDGVWEARVRNGIEESNSDALLFGSKNIRGGPTASDPIRFVKYDDEKLRSIQDEMLRTQGFLPGLSMETH